MSTYNKKTGQVVWFSQDKGYGFIQPADTSDKENQLFVHYSDIEGSGYRSLVEGEVVEFDTEDAPRGLKAVNVQRVQ